MILEWTDLAIDNLQALHAYIAEQNPRAAVEVVEQVLQTANLLTRSPEMGRIGRVPQTRELVISNTPYIVAYQTTKDHIFILAIIHGARRWPGSLPVRQF